MAEQLEDWKSGLLTRLDRLKPDKYLVAAEGEQLLGFLEGHHEFSNWGLMARYAELPTEALGSYVPFIYVVPERRGNGVGAALLREFAREAAARSSAAIVLQPDEADNGRSSRIEFFKQNGFTWEEPSVEYSAHEPWLMSAVPIAITQLSDA
ncbi:GNAT family N-acetyltransferase [Kribbella hippodromi]|uniref:GNAT family N-acetyltransferase n=1 Tax=Kribbella hippodromi TaxID=434347 RepID=UPI0031D9CFCE